jgi:hypothetical protein
MERIYRSLLNIYCAESLLVFVPEMQASERSTRCGRELNYKYDMSIFQPSRSGRVAEGDIRARDLPPNNPCRRHIKTYLPYSENACENIMKVVV